MKAVLSKAVLLAVAASVLSACGLFYVEAVEPQICESVPFQLPASPPSQKSTTLSLSHNLTVPNITADPHVQVNLVLQSVRFEPQAGISDLSFVDDLQLTADTGQSGCNQVSLGQYNNSSGQSVQNISMDGPNQDLSGCILSTGNSGNRQLAVNLLVSGRLPSHDATIAMTSCFSAKLRLNYASH